MNKILLLLLFLIAFNQNSFSQLYKYQVLVGISGRVDTTYNEDVKDIYHLFKNYLEARPDSFYNNPYWTKFDKYGKDSGCISIFYKGFYSLHTAPKKLFQQWKPYILTIEKNKNAKYLLRVALVQDSVSDLDKFLTILQVNAVKEDGRWVLQNTYSDIVESWTTKQEGYIKYIYPPSYQFNEVLAKKSIRFCDSISSLLHINRFDSFTFLITDKVDNMGLLFGYEFFYQNYTTGMTDPYMNRIYSAKGNEFYPHEFVHMILKGNIKGDLNYILQEGLSCFLGELSTEKYDNWFYYLADDYLKNKPTYTLHHLLTNTSEYNGYSTAYSTGCVLIEVLYDRKGINGLIELINTKKANTEAEIYDTFKTLTGLNEKELEKAFKEKLIQKTNYPTKK